MGLVITGPRTRRLHRAAIATSVVVTLLAAGCTGSATEDPAGEGAVREVLVDGGSETAVAIAGVDVAAAPGEVVRITNANSGPEGRVAAEEASVGTVVHAFTSAPAEALPPLFVTGQGGAAPNAGVWGSCRGGAPAEAVGGCPIPPIEGPEGWDGTTYWSTGAMLPTESRDVPLATDIPPGTHRLVCAIHPALFVDVVVSEDPAAAPAERSAPAPAPIEEVVEAAVGGVAAAGPAAPADAVEVAVAPTAQDTSLNVFWPATATVAAGGTVTWVTDVRTPHDVVLGAEEPPELTHTEPTDALPALPDGAWDGRSPIRSGYMSTDPSAPGGTTAEVTFAEPGSYTYYCRFHPGMTGTVVVS